MNYINYTYNSLRDIIMYITFLTTSSLSTIATSIILNLDIISNQNLSEKFLSNKNLTENFQTDNIGDEINSYGKRIKIKFNDIHHNTQTKYPKYKSNKNTYNCNYACENPDYYDCDYDSKSKSGFSRVILVDNTSCICNCNYNCECNWGWFVPIDK